MRLEHAGMSSRTAFASVAVVCACLMAPAVASASYFMSLGQAERTARASVHAVGHARISSLEPGCWPSYRRHSAGNRARRWHLWTCDWIAKVTKPDGSSAVCVGEAQITGKRRGSTARPLRPVRCKPLAPPSTAPMPVPAAGSSPAPGAAPGPAPQPQPDRTQALINHAFEYAKQVGDAQIHTGGYYKWLVDPKQCTLVHSFESRCTVWLWKQVPVQDSNLQNAGYQIELWREYAFSTETAPYTYFDEALQTDYGPVDIVCTDAQPANYPRCN